ncbi:MAG: primase C-terminal domain-containing protein [Clostridia bacterium]
MAPPSIHPNGMSYEWEQSPDEYAIAPANELVYQLIEYGRYPTNGFAVPEKVLTGERNQSMFRFACSLQSKGFSDEAIIAAIQIENEKRCDPPPRKRNLKKPFKAP